MSIAFANALKEILATVRFPVCRICGAASDKASTLPVGCHDFTIFYKGQCFVIECKTRTGKLDKDQQTWAHLMAAQGWVVHIVRSYQQFLELINL